MSTEPALPLEQIFRDQLDRLATTLRPNTVRAYRNAVNHFLRYLRTQFPQVQTFSDLRRDPHILGWMRFLCQQNPPFCTSTRIVYLAGLQRVLTQLALSGQYSVAGYLIHPGDFPTADSYLPRPLTPQDDRLLQQYLRNKDDLVANGLLLLRATGMRISELFHLPADCLRPLGADQWALLVPLGKLHSERLIPVDDEIRRILARILSLRQHTPIAATSLYLFPWPGSDFGAYAAWWRALHDAIQQAGCSAPITLHQLRHTFATEMIRAGISLPALMSLLGHKNIRMTLRYVEITLTDLQRQYQQARQQLPTLPLIPQLAALSGPDTTTVPGIPAILRSLADLRNLMEMYRRQLGDDPRSRKIARLINRVAKIVAELDPSGTA
jgi:site-specific recombinase XerD